MSDLQLKVDGKIYSGWKSIRIQRGMRRFSDTFDLSLTEKWTGQNQSRPIKEDSPCKVEIDGEPVIVGFVDDVNVDYDSGSHEVSVVGRSQLSDLIDCSQSSKTFKNETLEQIAIKICNIFNINVIVECDVGEAFNSKILSPGETYCEFLQGLASYRAVHLTSNAAGHFVIARASKQRINTALILGENILSGSGTRSKRGRYHKYMVYGQQPGNDHNNGTSSAHVYGEATDKNIREVRTKSMPADDLNPRDAQRLAENERNIAYGESQIKKYTVNGWKHDDGLWEPNKLVAVKDAYQEIDEDLLITHVTFIMDEDGQRTELELMPPEGMDLIPLPEKESDESWLLKQS